MPGSESLLICVACGTQFDSPANEPLKACRICDDPRQFIPPEGQMWTSLAKMRGKYENKWQQDEFDERIWHIWTEPKFGIGQRAMLLRTANGNVLWECVTYLDDATVDFINSQGGIKAIVISHPHFYSAHVDWAAAFGCPVHIAKDDAEWLNRSAPEGTRILRDRVTTEILPGVEVIKAGGHFPGSSVLLWEGHLMHADTLLTVPSALYHVDRLPGTTSFAFMWSIPNMIPLPPPAIFDIWQALKPLEFHSTYGVFKSQDVRDKNIKARVLESMKIQTRNETGHEDHAIMKESWQTSCA